MGVIVSSDYSNKNLVFWGTVLCKYHKGFQSYEQILVSGVRTSYFSFPWTPEVLIYEWAMTK